VKKCIFLIFLFSVFFIAKIRATHIVGGEFELIHITDSLYNLNLILYFDQVNGNPGAEDAVINARIFRKSDKALIQSITLVNQSSSFVPYSIVECAIGSLVTRRIFYTTQLILLTSTYNDPAGYYIVWERCCRNFTITNIANPGGTGQTFLLEFPPVVKEGEPFINSSPTLFPPLRDYACVNQFYFVDFSGTDPDGDSLVYSLVNPLNSSTAQAIPIPTPPPHPVVTWSSGISLSDVIPGNPTLKISENGLLTVVPNQTGLFVFSVLAEEYRDGVRIGEVRRDFQMLVIDCPDPGDPPQVAVKKPGSSDFESEFLAIQYGRDEEKCLEFLVTDQNQNENIRIRVETVNFNGDINNLISINSGFITGEEDTLKVNICFPDCPYLEDEPFIIDLIAFDDACPQGLADTLRLSVDIEPPFNQNPFFVNSNPVVSASIREGDVYQLFIDGRDNDLDSLILDRKVEDFEPADFGMSFSEQVHDPNGGRVTTTFTWDTGCDTYDFTEKTEFDFLLDLNDLDICLFGKPDTLILDLNVILPPNTDPIVSTSLNTSDLTMKINQSLNFNVFGEDSDNDFVVLNGVGEDFQFQDFDIQFEADSGFTNVSSPFQWNLTCENIDLTLKDEFKFYFLVQDRDKCKFPNADSISINVKVLPPDNTNPNLSYVNLNQELQVLNGEVEVQVGQSLNLNIIGADVDNDSISLSLLEVIGDNPAGLTFEPATGKGSVISNLLWEPECGILKENFTENIFDFKFLLTDDKCINDKSDTLNLKVIIKDLETTQSIFLPPNVFTPNDDGYNDFFELANLNIPEENRLPDDNCASHFIGIIIYNRWGKIVFSDTRRDFRWFGKDMATGVYYYRIEFNSFEFKGIVSILF